MSLRILSAIAAAVTAVLLLCSGLATTLIGAGGAGTVGCDTAVGGPASSTATAGATAGVVGPIGAWNAEQVGNAATIVAAGRRLGVLPRGWVIAVATAMPESTLINTAGGADDSVGLFQQRPSHGWGTPQQLHDADYAATAFYQRLVAVDRWQALPLTEAAQQVQRSAHPGAYARWEPDATHLVAALTGPGADPAACGVTVSAEGWTQPVHGTVGSGFRTPDRPGHDGVDLIAPEGAPIRAAAAGTVTVVRCNAIDIRTGADWGCDRAGNPALTRGCGWYADIDHVGGIVTRYCHQLVQPSVHTGQKVAVGQVIGVVGSSGHSSGPHLHFEVHRGDHTPATAVDPVAFMAAVGASLKQNER
jgi:murein DD-endopeptidase MepM/ murein hydrolase activator NlpD